MTYDAMTCFVEKRGEAALARLMHKAIWPEKPKRQKFGRPDNRTGKQAEHVTRNIGRVKKFKGIFSIRNVADGLDIPRGQAAHLIKVMLKKNQIHRAPQLGGESEFKYKVEIESVD